MAGSAYIALSGLRTRSEQLDRLASDIANVGTAGYKSERRATVAAERETFDRALQSAIDVAPGANRVDFRPGTIGPTGRDLDFAIDGRGFFELQTPAGSRYTRNGHFERRRDGVLATPDGLPVLGEAGPITIGAGTLTVDPDGTVRVGKTPAGKLKVVDVDDYKTLTREGASRFRLADGLTAKPRGDGEVRGGALEGSNVSIVERIANLTEVTRSFESLQRAISILMNDIDGKAITELGRR